METPSSPEPLSLNMLRGDGQRGQWLATPADALRQGKGETEAALEKHTEQRRINSCEW